MLFLLDANVLIDANRDYYSFDVVPEFWSWLIHMGNQDRVKIPLEAYEEIKDGNDNLALWAKEMSAEEALLFPEETNIELVQTVIQEGYAPDLSDIEIEKIGRDPFLIAYALNDIRNRCLVTTEKSAPGKKRANRRIPDVCNDLSITSCHTFIFVKKLGFKTKWEISTT